MTHISTYTSCAGGLAPLQASLLDLEASTVLQRTYNPHLVTGLLQTRAYATAVFSACVDVLDVPDDIEQAVTARLARQRLLGNPDHQFCLLIGEAALLRTVGGPEVMAEQIRHLQAVLTHAGPNVEIGIVPVDAPLVAPGANFVLREHSVDIETVIGVTTSTDARELALATRTFDRLCQIAAYRADAHAILAGALCSHTSEPEGPLDLS
ncbi:DUF5753 domain-containing protein [Nocardia sp. NPDC050435]|uniref:DUF5753 domain-containing protein n=1 Tax=Nocardia sp. NPDC050435 TaxID=3155040 RepID=UPI0034034179